jgi:hypothetical protein
VEQAIVLRAQMEDETPVSILFGFRKRHLKYLWMAQALKKIQYPTMHLKQIAILVIGARTKTS